MMTDRTIGYDFAYTNACHLPGYDRELHADLDAWLQNWIVANPAPTNPHRGELWAGRAHAEYWQRYKQNCGATPGFPFVALLLPALVHALIGVLVRLTLHRLFPDTFDRSDLTAPGGPA